MYLPSDDSFFFSDFIKKYLKKLRNKNIQIVDMGSGSGILAETALKSGIKKENILSADINPKVVKYLKSKNINALKSNLFSKIKNKKFDIILFNAPYLPKDKREPKDSRLETTGGRRGDEISLRFLNQAKKHLNKHGKILLLISSLTPRNRIEKFKPKIVARKSLFFEELLILEFS